MKNLCKTIGIVTLIGGIIISILSAYLFGREVNTTILKSFEPFVRNWGLTILYLFVGLFVTVAQSVIYFALSKIFERFDMLCNDDEEMEHTPEYIGNGWKCECGRTNPNYTGTCTCGRTKP